jgi:hypothetical protein
MNLINREGNTFTEAELNQLVQFLGELPYSEVSELFNLIPVLVQKEEVMPVPESAPETTSEKPAKKSK